MKNLFKVILALFSIFVCLSAQAGEHIFLGPSLKARLTTPVNDYTALSLLAEAGKKSYRGDATLGWNFLDDQFLKATIDFLAQDLTYSFFGGDVDKWMKQWSFSAEYVYDFVKCRYHPQVDLIYYYSHASSKTLSPRRGIFLDPATKTLQSFFQPRRIAGADAWGLAPGASVELWCNGRIGANINYDNVNYDKTYDNEEDANGLGGTIYLEQRIIKHININLSAEFRQPYNNYTARISWDKTLFRGLLALGIEGIYTAGKNTLPSTYNTSITLDYFLDPCPCSPLRDIPTNHMNFLNWAATPAHYQPQVLAVADEAVFIIPQTVTPAPTPGCPDGNPPAVVNTIPDIAVTTGSTATVAAAQAFSGNNLTFSVSTSTAAATVSIVPTTGVISITGASATTVTFPITVTATNRCGSASTSFNVTIFIPTA